jgi:hypothetical protein
MMSIKRLITILGLSVALTGLPLTLEAATSNECACGKPTAASYTWDFHREADTLFQGIQFDAQQVSNHAANLQSFADDPNISWQAHATELTQLKSEVNNMGKKICRLETIRRVVAPWQQETIDRIASTLPLMADNTEGAIAYVNAHQHDLLNPTYWRYADNLYSEGTELTQLAGNAVDYAKVLGEYHKLRNEVGVTTKAS